MSTGERQQHAAVAADRSGTQAVTAILVWSALGAAMALFSIWVFGQWLSSPTQLAPVPAGPAASLPAGMQTRIVCIEILSSMVLLWAVFHYLLRPWWRSGRAPIEGLLLIGALISYVLDTTINYHAYVMAWNRHALNFGTWAAFFPGHTGPTRYAEALLWGPPMYVYFGVILGSIQLWCVRRLKPTTRSATTLAWAVSFVVAFVFDLVAESLIIRCGAYAWPRTIGALTLWPGTQFQFPLYESLLVAIYSSFYALLIKSAQESSVAFIERGEARFPKALRLPLRLLAATGFAAVCTGIYFGGFYLFSQHADLVQTLPSYLQPAA